MRHESDYAGYGVCPDCNGHMGRRRVFRTYDRPLTVDRCKECGQEWCCEDGGSRRWVPVGERER